MFESPVLQQSSCKIGLALAYVVRILHDDWSIRLGGNRACRAFKYYGGFADKEIKFQALAT